MPKQISRAVQNIQRLESQEQYQDQLDREELKQRYDAETDPRERLDMLSEAVKNGVVYLK